MPPSAIDAQNGYNGSLTINQEKKMWKINEELLKLSKVLSEDDLRWLAKNLELVCWLKQRWAVIAGLRDGTFYPQRTNVHPADQYLERFGYNKNENRSAPWFVVSDEGPTLSGPEDICKLTWLDQRKNRWNEECRLQMVAKGAKLGLADAWLIATHVQYLPTNFNQPMKGYSTPEMNYLFPGTVIQGADGKLYTPCLRLPGKTPPEKTETLYIARLDGDPNDPIYRILYY